MAWDPFNDYRQNGYLQNIHRLPLGNDLLQKDNLQPRSSIVLFENHIDWLHHPKTLPRFVFDGG